MVYTRQYTIIHYSKCWNWPLLCWMHIQHVGCHATKCVMFDVWKCIFSMCLLTPLCCKDYWCIHILWEDFFKTMTVMESGSMNMIVQQACHFMCTASWCVLQLSQFSWWLVGDCNKLSLKSYSVSLLRTVGLWSVMFLLHTRTAILT